MSDQPNPEPLPGGRPAVTSSRRTVLRAAGLLTVTGGAVLVTACAADGDSAAAPSAAPGDGSPSAPGPASPTSPAASSASSEASDRPTKSAKAPSGPSVATSKVPVGGGVILTDADYVITQPTKGTYKAFTKICTHQGCAVAEVANGVIHCDCHGSEFSIKDGSVLNPPASRPLAEHDVTVSDGKVYVS
jgi:Rieske Fe-S protein